MNIVEMLKYTSMDTERKDVQYYCAMYQRYEEEEDEDINIQEEVNKAERGAIEKDEIEKPKTDQLQHQKKGSKGQVILKTLM